jgi:predicted  nucleic acid-binding Zn-ribbon protein
MHFPQFHWCYSHQDAMEESQMRMPALKLEPEEPVIEERVARLESDVKHIQSDVSEIKIDVRRLNDKIDAVDQKVDDFRVSVEKQFGEFGARMEKQFGEFGVRMEKGFAKINAGLMIDRVWWLLISAGLLGVMARAFKWL